MFHIEQILVPTNLSDAARQAYPHAVAFARTLGARLTLLHADELNDPRYQGEQALAGYLDTASGVRQGHAAEAQAELAELGRDAALELATGPPRTAIERYLREHEVDLVVMAKHNRPRADLVLGATAKRVLRLLQVPVLVVHVPAAARPDDLPAYRHIVTATDLSDSSNRGLRATLALAEAFDARMTLVHVLRIPTMLPLGKQPVPVPRDGVASIQQHREHQLARRIRDLGSERVSHVLVMGAKVGDAIVETAQREGADLITIPSTGRGMLQRLILGSTAERVAKRSPIPVLVMPPPFLARWEQ